MKLSLLLVCFLCIKAAAQPMRYTTANAHSHNDYHQPLPFSTAYQHGFGSIEADIFLYRNELIVAHDTQELRLHHTLDQYYLQPVLQCIAKNGGSVYADTGRQLQLLIDVKTDSIATLDKLIQLIEKYPVLIHTPTLKWVISGNRPAQELFSSYPPYILFDAELQKDYSPAAWGRIAMLSDNFARYSRWNGTGALPEKELLQSAISNARKHNKPVRFWNAPDSESAWQQLMELQVDFINTDHIVSLDDYLKRVSSGK